ncbi:GAF domain-containing protein [Aggregatilinea lenta]|uniref:GAF domain-containing protein n=1 Tax=Aggregatilinea lenta TaxID=913108 RepID=UPI0013C34BCD|nr:GAF domain-containing protein [Aggregatilinea lenta]
MQAHVTFPRSREHLPGILLALAVLLVAAVLLIADAAAAWRWRDQPFLGVLPARDLTLDASQGLSDEAWPALDAGLQPGDRVIALDGVDLAALPIEERVGAFRDALNARNPGDTVSVVFRRDDVDARLASGVTCDALPGEEALVCTTNATLIALPDVDFAGYFGIGWLAAILVWGIGAALFIRQPSTLVIRLGAMLAAALAVVLAGWFDTHTTHRLVEAWLVACCLEAALLIAFGLVFPYRYAFLQRTPAWAWAPIVAGLALSAVGIALYHSAGSPSRQTPLFALGMLLVGLLALVGMSLLRRVRAASPLAHNQISIALLGLVPWLAAALVGFGWQAVAGELPPALILLNQALPVLLPLSMVYALSQSRPTEADRFVTQSVLYSVVIGVLVVAYWLIVTGLALLLDRTVLSTASSPLVIATTVFGIAVLFMPLRQAMQRLVDATYFRGRRAYQLLLERFAREVANAVTLHDVIALVQQYMTDALAPEHVTLFVRNVSLQAYRPEPDPVTGLPLTDVTFGFDSGLARALRDEASLIYLQEGRPLPLDVVSDRAKLALVGAPLIVRLKGQRALNGFLAIGQRRSGAAYTQEDLRFIENLSDQIALAVERAQVVDDLERRMRVQDVLSQVSRALNFAIDFDTLLELIYAQTSRVIDAPNFYIALRNPNVDELTYVFYNEGDERVLAKEGARWRMGLDLISEIARTQQTLRTDDFVRETLARDADAEITNTTLKAWMGVPLLADTGTGVLGVMVAANTASGVTFSDDQQDLFWDIANLAASAIDKLQLFNKTQQRARQLSAINEISSHLAAELGDVDRLLRMITESAVQILGTEAGSLLLVDEETNDLEFRVVVGGAGDDRTGTRIPAGIGLAGATVQRGAPIIVNDTLRDSRWYGDLHTAGDVARTEPGGNGSGSAAEAFRSHAILSVPLLVQGRAIGVLQTINKQDGSIFISEDADLLETFAGQAAIAIENARLFNMTDQQLALRVQELDTMQRIDQELNRTLNLNNVVDITMEWALRKSGATTGALFILDRERNVLRLVASYGYAEDSPFSMGGSLAYPADQGITGRVIRSGQPSLITDVSIDPDYRATLPGCVAQLIVPLFTANQVIGMIILESNREGVLDLLDLDFVARLAEHASPAIVNARLYQELERANQSKSEFVSFVAHELKNPMTSMKGYTDLLIKGVVGPVNEQQSDFLHTIFSNVARMETLVSDLNDLTKQETNNLRLEIAPVNLRAILLETLRAQQRAIDEKGQRLAVQVPEDLPLVRGDQNRLIQVMTNLVSNAHKYTPPNGRITLRAEVARNTWEPQGAPYVVHVSVQDTGIGLSEEDLHQLFVPYFRSENPKTREQPGTGLGLTITRGLIQMHGGRIWVDSELEVGSTFHFTVPLATEAEQAAAQGS